MWRVAGSGVEIPGSLEATSGLDNKAGRDRFTHSLGNLNFLAADYLDLWTPRDLLLWLVVCLLKVNVLAVGWIDGLDADISWVTGE